MDSSLHDTVVLDAFTWVVYASRTGFGDRRGNTYYQGT